MSDWLVEEELQRMNAKCRWSIVLRTNDGGVRLGDSSLVVRVVEAKIKQARRKSHNHVKAQGK